MKTMPNPDRSRSNVSGSHFFKKCIGLCGLAESIPYLRLFLKNAHSRHRDFDTPVVPPWTMISGWDMTLLCPILCPLSVKERPKRSTRLTAKNDYIGAANQRGSDLYYLVAGINAHLLTEGLLVRI